MKSFRIVAALCLLVGVSLGQSPPTSTSQITFPVSTSLTLPSANVVLVGNPGPQQYFYWLVANYPLGPTDPAGPFLAANSPNVLSISNYLSIVPTYPQGVTSLDLLRTNSPAQPAGNCNCAVATGVFSGIIFDQSNGLQAYTVAPSVRPSDFNITITNEPVGTGAAHAILRQNGIQIADLFNLSGGTITTPASDTQVIFNQAGSLTGQAGLTFDYVNNILSALGAFNAPTYLLTGNGGFNMIGTSGVLPGVTVGSTGGFGIGPGGVAQTNSGAGWTNVQSTGTAPIVVSGSVISCPTCGTGSGNVTNSGTPTANQIATWVDATHVQGITLVPVANGGTNLGSGTSGGILGYTAGGILASSVALTSNVLVKGGGAGATPTNSGVTDNGTTVSTSEKISTTGNLAVGGGSPWIDVTSPTYGADPTGVADSSAAINSAIAACPASGGVVYFPPGTYLHTAIITVNQRCTLKGWGRESTLKKGYSTTSGNTHGSVQITASNVTIENLEYDGQNGSFTGNCFIAATAVTDILFSNTYIHNCDGVSIGFTNNTGSSSCTRCRITGSRIIGGANVNGAGTIWFSQVADTISIDNNPLIDGSAMSASGNATLQIQSGALTGAINNVSILNNRIICPGGLTWCIQGGAFNAYQSVGWRTIGNTLELSAVGSQGFISIAGTVGKVISGNTFNSHFFDLGYTYTFSVIENANGIGTVISNNTCYCETSGSTSFVGTDGNSGTVITGNTVFGFGESGTGTSAALLVFANQPSQSLGGSGSASETGNVITITTTAALNTTWQPGQKINLSGFTPSTYNGDYVLQNASYSRTGGTFTLLSPVTGLASCNSGCGAGTINYEIADVVVEANTVYMPQQGNITAATTIYGMWARVAQTGIVARVLFKGNHIYGTKGGAGNEECGTISGATGTVDSVTFEGNVCSNLDFGLGRTFGTNPKFLNNTMIGVTTQFTGSAQAGEIISLPITAPTRLTGDSASITATTAATAVTEFSFSTLQANTNYVFQCVGSYIQSTGNAAIGVAVQGATNAPTYLRANAIIGLSTTTTGGGDSAGITTTTYTQVANPAGAAFGTILPFTIDGAIEVGATVPVLNIGFFTGNASDGIVLKRDSNCKTSQTVN